jgi:hypothetical protein
VEVLLVLLYSWTAPEPVVEAGLMLTTGEPPPVTLIGAVPVREVSGVGPEDAAVMMPRELTVKEALVYEPAPTPEIAVETVTFPTPDPGETLMPLPARI